MRWVLWTTAALLTLIAIAVIAEPKVMLSLLGPDGYWGQGQWGYFPHDKSFLPDERALGRALSIRIAVGGVLALIALACVVKTMVSREEAPARASTPPQP